MFATNRPRVEVLPNRKAGRSKLYDVFVDGDLYDYSLPKHVAEQRAQAVRTELACAFSAEQLSTLQIINQFLRSN